MSLKLPKIPTLGEEEKTKKRLTLARRARANLGLPANNSASA